jgi:hypothetical protein
MLLTQESQRKPNRKWIMTTMQGKKPPPNKGKRRRISKKMPKEQISQ